MLDNWLNEGLRSCIKHQMLNKEIIPVPSVHANKIMALKEKF